MTITFSFPVKDKLLLKQGQDVDFTTPIVKKGEQEQRVVPLSELLKIPPQKIFLFMKKFVGEEIARGDLLAEKKGVLDKKQYFSEYDGVLKEIDHEKGDLIIESQVKKKQTVNSFFKGKIDSVKKNEITLVVKEMKKFSTKEPTADFGGETLYVEESAMGEITPETVRNKVILADSLKPHIQSKLEVMGAVGFISPQNLNDSTPPAFAKIQSQDDWEQVKKTKLPYCLVDKKSATIYFYQS